MQLSTLNLSMTRPGIVPFSVSSLFSNNEQGVWYDPSDLTTLFQDAAGTTPVTAVEQPVGLMLDKSTGLTLGPELVTNGTFDTDSGWTNSGSVVWSGGSYTVSDVGGADGYIQQTLTPTVAGTLYQIVISISSGTGRIYIGSSFRTVSAGTRTVYIVAPTSGTYVRFMVVTSDTSAVVDSISVREIQGNHAYQTTSANRPTLSARYNLLTKTEQFDDVAWTGRVGLLAFGSGSVANTTETTDPLGGNTADLLAMDGSTGVHTLRQDLSSAQTGSGYKRIRLKYKDWQYFCIQGPDTTTAVVVDVLNGTVTSSGSNATGVLITKDANGWVDLRFTSNQSRYYILLFNNGPTYNTSFTGTSGAGIYIWGADLRVANDGVGIPAYQRVNTATDYDTVGFPTYLRFNGSSSSMVTNTITPGIDKAQVFAGVRKLSDTTSGLLVELSSSSLNNGAFSLFVPGGTTLRRWSWSTAAPQAFIGTADIPAPSTAVMSAIMDRSAASSAEKIGPRLNGVTPTLSEVSQGSASGNFLGYPLYIGARAGTSIWLNGRVYSMIVRFGSNLTTAQITNTENYVNSKTKAY